MSFRSSASSLHPFILPMHPTLAITPPAGEEWLHECKFDGFRAQVHVEGGHVAIYSRRGADMTKRFRSLKSAIVAVPVESAIIDCEVIAMDENGQSDFRALMNRRSDRDYCLWAFDLLAIDGYIVTEKPLFQRRFALQELLSGADQQGIQFSQAFDDAGKLLDAAQRMGLEGIVSKRRESLYRSGPSSDWIKVKTAARRAANADRGEIFE